MLQKFKFKNFKANFKWVRNKLRVSQERSSEQPSASLHVSKEHPPTSHELVNSSDNANQVEPVANDSEEEEESPSSEWRTAKGAATLALELTEKALDGLPIPGAKGAIGGVLHVMKTINKNNSNAESLRSLEKHVAELRAEVLQPLIGIEQKNIPTDLQSDIQTLVDILQKLGKIWISRRNRSALRQVVDAAEDEQDLQDFSEGIKRATDRFQVSGNIQARLAMARQEHGLAEIQASMAINELPRAKEASFSSGRAGAPSLCFTGTRTTILETITDWLEDGNQPTLFWLNGLAGIGKSTIAKTISQYANDHKILGGSFFFSRGDKMLSDASLVFPTLAFQLAQFDPFFKRTLGKILKQNTDYGYEAAPTQLDKLIITPLRESNTPRKILLFVVDALDECSSKEKTAELLHLLLAHSTRFPFIFRIFITSRPENYIRTVLNRESNIAKIVLHDIETSIVRNDIYAYLREELGSLPKKLDVNVGSGSWPKETDLNAIVEKSGRFFIYAATAIKFIGKDPPRNPQRHLNILLGIQQVTNAKLSPYIDLDNLYLAVLRNAFPDDSEEEDIKRFRWVVGCIILMLDPLSIEALGRFTQTDPEDINRTLYHLHSVIISPTSFQEAPHIYHPSFRDFLTERCSDSMFAVVSTQQERRLLLRCLELMMGSLTRDVAQIGDYWCTNDDFDDLQAIADSALTTEVQYSCLHWASHLLFLEGDDEEISAKLYEFASVRLLNWFEAMSLLESTPSAVSIMRNVHEWAMRSSSDKNLTTLLYDGYRFILSYQVVIAKGALQVYRSALPFTPHETLLYQIYQSQMYDSFHVLHGIGSKWSPRLSTVHCRHDGLISVAYSPEGRYFATGFNDSYINVWDSISCVGVMTFRHSETPSEALPVAFTPDGLRLISGNSGANVTIMYLWDILSGTSILTFQGHAKGINSLSICPKTSILASGSNDTTIRIWEISSGSCKATLKRGESPVWSVLFLPDGSQQLLSGSGDSGIRLWDVKTRTLLRTFGGHAAAVRALSISQDGLRFASGSDDHTVKLFFLSNDQAIATFPGHSEPVYSLAFSPTDPSRLISAGPGDFLRVWNVDSQTPLVMTLRGGSTEVAFSPDGRTLVSAHTDGTFRVWDAIAAPVIEDPNNHTRWVQCVAFSSDGHLLATGGDHIEKVIKIWDAISGNHIRNLVGHTWAVYALAFSPDGSKLASGSGDYTARIWDVQSGELVAVMENHDNYVKAIDFSEDGRHVVSRTNDTTYIWSLEQPGTLLNSFSSANENPSNGMGGTSNGFFSPWGPRIGCICHVVSNMSREELELYRKSFVYPGSPSIPTAWHLRMSVVWSSSSTFRD